MKTEGGADSWDLFSDEQPRDIPPVSYPDCGTSLCPICYQVCACVDHESVDVGVGHVTGNHTYTCPTHGEFSGDGIMRYAHDRCPDCDARAIQDISNPNGNFLGLDPDGNVRPMSEWKYIHALKDLLRGADAGEHVMNPSKPRVDVRMVIQIDAMRLEEIKLLVPHIFDGSDWKKR